MGGDGRGDTLHPGGDRRIKRKARDSGLVGAFVFGGGKDRSTLRGALYALSGSVEIEDEVIHCCRLR